MSLVRLDKLITDSGFCSRSQAKEHIRQGVVLVNGQPAADPAMKLDPACAEVTVNGETIDSSEHIYVMLHKPAGLLSATEDPRKPTVLDLMPPEWKRRGLFPVGRLDKDTTGLLILTDDGDYAHRVISPKSHVAKLYEAVVEGTPTEEDVRAFEDGILLADGTQCMPARLQLIGASVVRVEVFEGKYHQVKRMLGSRRLPVQKLHRLSVGGLTLSPSLAVGEYRRMTPEEVQLSLLRNGRNDENVF